jgi:hypothetical protein
VQRSPAHLARLTDLDLENKITIGQIFDLL